MTRVKHTVILVVGDSGRSPGQTRKNPKDLSGCDREERGRGEGGVRRLCGCDSEECEDGVGAGVSVISLAVNRFGLFITNRQSESKRPIRI